MGGRTWTRRWVDLLLLAGLSVAACAPTATVTSRGGPTIQQAQQEAYDGPKARITVQTPRQESTTTTSGSTSIVWLPNPLNEAVAQMLATALFHTNHFIVIERQQLWDVLKEQDLGTAGRLRPATAAPSGEIEGAELIVLCAVRPRTPGGSGGGTLLGGVSQSRITLDLRLVDARTSRLVAAASIEGKATDWSVGLPLVADLYSKMAQDEGLRVAVDEAARFIVSQTPAVYYRR